MKLDDFLLELKRSDRWLCSHAWRRSGLLNPLADSCYLLACPPSSAVIRKHLTTSSLIYGRIWRAIFQSSQTFDTFQYMHWAAQICRHNLIKIQSCSRRELETVRLSNVKWHWCRTSRRYANLCSSLVMTTFKASEIWSVRGTQVPKFSRVFSWAVLL